MLGGGPPHADIAGTSVSLRSICSTIASSSFTGAVLVLLDCCLEYATGASTDWLEGSGPVPTPSPCTWFIGYAAGEGSPAQFSEYLGTPCHFTAALVAALPDLLVNDALGERGPANMVHRAAATFSSVQATVLRNSRHYNQRPWCKVYSASSPDERGEVGGSCLDSQATVSESHPH